LTLRGGNAVDSYDQAEPFDAERDQPSDDYIEAFAFWGLAYLDAKSWRHYLPKLIDYALRRPDDPAMAVEALIRTLRPPDRYPPRLATLTPEQEAAIVAFLESVALEDRDDSLREDAQQALEEWWLPDARSRTTDDDVAKIRAAPVVYQSVERKLYTLSLPVGFGSSGARDIPEESRMVEVWSGVLCGDAPAVIAVNVMPLQLRSIPDTLERAASGLRAGETRSRVVNVRGADRAERVDGLTRGHSPAEPERITLVAATAGASLVLLTVRSWPRPDVDVESERIVGSFALS
jgi:hypothetical protein